MDEKELKYKHWLVTIMNDSKGTTPLPPEDEVRNCFDKCSEKWVFQEEVHENSELKTTHYQCCLTTAIRYRKTSLLNKLASELSHPKERIRVDRMKGTWDQATLYCSKEESRVGDTVRSASMQNVYAYEDIAFLKDPSERYGWQNTLLKKLYEQDPHLLKDPDDRTIYWVTDETGNCGKSKLVKYLCAYNDNVCKLSFGTANQIRSGVAALGAKQLYILDVPRTLGEDDSVNDLLSAMEDIKNGYVVSSFYGSYTKLLMAPPALVVFSNLRCPVSKLSQDRWKCFLIKEDKELYYAKENEDYFRLGYSCYTEGEKNPNW